MCKQGMIPASAKGYVGDACNPACLELENTKNNLALPPAKGVTKSRAGQKKIDRAINLGFYNLAIGQQPTSVLVGEE